MTEVGQETVGFTFGWISAESSDKLSQPLRP